MRNGNACFCEIFAFVRHTFYPTYEEWKLVIEFMLGSESFKLFILPMRNGNLYIFFLRKHKPTLFILPMRNGNKARKGDKTSKLFLFILPMRNGNELKTPMVAGLFHFLSYL